MTFANAPQNRPRGDTTDRLTDAHRRMIFRLKTDRGLTIDDVRDMTPAGSISMLTKFQATSLIDALKTGKPVDYSKRSRIPAERRSKRRPKNVFAMASDAQRNTIEALRIELGWSKEHLHDWLSKRHHKDGRPMTEIQSSGDAVAVIELLKAVRIRQHRANERRKEGIRQRP